VVLALAGARLVFSSSCNVMRETHDACACSFEELEELPHLFQPLGRCQLQSLVDLGDIDARGIAGQDLRLPTPVLFGLVVSSVH